MSDYTRWYRVGSVALTKNSKIITGTGTFWLAAGLNPGDLFTVDASQFYEVQTIDSNTQITLKTAYSGNTTTETEYAIIRNFTAALPAQVAAQTADLLNDFRQFVDLKMQSIHGKSAYQIAVAHGYTGTESQWLVDLQGDSPYDLAVKNGYNGTESDWLESLKAAGEWSTLDARTEMLAANNSAIRNCLYRGKNLGEFTSAHLAEIKAGTFRDMWLGDYFTHGSRRYAIAGFNRILGGNNIVLYFMDRIVSTDDYLAVLEQALDDPQGDSADWQYQYAHHHYAETHFYLNVRPFVITELEEIFGANNLKQFPITVPSASSIVHWHGPATISAWVTLKSKLHLPNLAMFGHTVDTRARLSVWRDTDQTLPLFAIHPGVVSPWAYSSDMFEQDHFAACSTGSWVLRPTGRVSHEATIYGAQRYDGTWYTSTPELKPVFIIA